MSLDHPADFVKHQSRDAFLGGSIHVLQPKKGFRAGFDSVLLGAAVGVEQGALLDLGSGVGTASLVALASRPGLSATLAESDPEMAALAVENLIANRFDTRARVLALDVTAPGRARAAAGLKTDHFATVIANPPFFSEGTGTKPAVSREAARHMPAEDLDAWVKTAASHAAPGGEIIFIHTAEALPALLTAFDARFGAITILPLGPTAGAPANRVLIRGIKGSRAPLTLLAGRALHTGGEIAPEFDAIFQGKARLVW